ncbi:hypothetical protein MTO96_042543 [Rhipicephalus appendiculatus]
MLSRELRTHISAVLPEPSSKGRRDNEDAPRSRKLHKGQPVLARQFHQKPEWVPAIVEKRIGLRSWLVEGNGGHAMGSSPPKSFNTAWLLKKEHDASEPAPSAHPAAPVEKTGSCSPANTAPTQRKSTRQRRPPDRFQAQN